MNGRSREWWAPRLLWASIIANAFMAVLNATLWRLTGDWVFALLATVSTATASGIFAVLRVRKRRRLRSMVIAEACMHMNVRTVYVKRVPYFTCTDCGRTIPAIEGP